MIFVCAEYIHEARAWCRENGIQPYGQDTRIMTPQSPHGGRGRMLTTEDRVVVLGDVDWTRMRLSLAPAGLGTVIQPEHVT